MSSTSNSNSTNQSTSSSTSTPVVAPINKEIAGLLKNLSGAAQGYAADTYKWANDQFAKTSQVTDAMASDAATYSSQSRIGSEMGRAEADTGQAMDRGATNATEQLRQYGVNPNSGMSIATKTAQAAEKAAAQAGAGQTQRDRTITMGQQLRAQAVNAELANTNTATAGKQVAGGFENTAAAALKYAPTSQQTNSQSQSTGSSHSSGSTSDPSQPSKSGGGGGGGSGSGGSGSGSSWNDPGNIPDYQYNQSDPSTIIHGNQPDASVMDLTGAGAQAMLTSTDSGQTSTDSGQTDTGTGDWTSTAENSGGGYAQGGAIPDQTTGGQVPQDASPSQGMQTDDVPAQLNAEEFVVPRDVARWKGEEFFQKLIAQSRKARMTAPAHGKPGVASPQGAPAFASQAMGA